MRTSYVVYANPVEGREVEFNRWYSETHIPEVLKIEGFHCAKRYRLNDRQIIRNQPYKYMTVYEIDGQNVNAVLANLTAAINEFTQSNAIDLAAVHITIFDQLDAAPAPTS